MSKQIVRMRVQPEKLVEERLVYTVSAAHGKIWGVWKPKSQELYKGDYASLNEAVRAYKQQARADLKYHKEWFKERCRDLSPALKGKYKLVVEN